MLNSERTGRFGTISRRRFNKVIGSGILGAVASVVGVPQCVEAEEELYVSSVLVKGFTGGAEGPACDIDGNLYAVNYQRNGTIGKVTPEGVASIFVELPSGSIGNGIRFNSEDYMFVADYKNHNVLKIDMNTKDISVYAHDSSWWQPNDLAIGADDVIYATDPNFADNDGRILRIDTDGSVSIIREGLKISNGIEIGPGETTLYVNETKISNVLAFDLSPDGELSNERLFFNSEEQWLDGMRCDVEGNLYVAHLGKKVIVVLSPDGDIIREIPLLTGGPSNIAFGGPDGRTCYVTIGGVGNIETFRVGQPGRSWKLYQDRKPSYVADAASEPQAYIITGNFPNPFNPDTAIKFSAPREGVIRLGIYNIMGQKVRTLISRTVTAGNHSVLWDGKDDRGRMVSSGVYISSLEAEAAVVTHRMTLLR